MEPVSEQSQGVIANFQVTQPTAGKAQAEVYGAGAAATRIVAAAAANLNEVFAQVNQYVETAAKHLRPAPGGPAETSIEFGIKVSADGTLYFVGTSTEVHIKVNVKWTRD
jgi:hypothetical protein